VSPNYATECSRRQQHGQKHLEGTGVDTYALGIVRSESNTQKRYQKYGDADGKAQSCCTVTFRGLRAVTANHEISYWKSLRFTKGITASGAQPTFVASLGTSARIPVV
jgi:hypothetical protein